MRFESVGEAAGCAQWSAPFSILLIEKPAWELLPVSGIFSFYAVHIPDSLVDAHAN